MIELGAKIPVFPEQEKTPELLLPGCQSQVWIKLSVNPQGVMVLCGDSDASLVKGMMAIVFILYKDKTPANVVALEIQPIFEQLSLTQHLTPTRTQGLAAMVEYIQTQAKTLL